jgi:hypothetical protein
MNLASFQVQNKGTKIQEIFDDQMASLSTGSSIVGIIMFAINRLYRICHHVCHKSL